MKLFVCILFVAVIEYTVVGYLLRFEHEPHDVTVPAGWTARLDCTARSENVSSNEISVKWFSGRYQFVHANDFEREATGRFVLANQTLVLTNVTTRHVYQCIAAIPRFGFILSRKAIVSAARLDGFLAEPEDIDVRPLEKALFSCLPNVSLPLRELQIDWFKDDQPIRLDDLRMTRLTTGALEIDRIRLLDDDGMYSCRVRLGQEELWSRRARLHVMSKSDNHDDSSIVSFIAIPRSQTVLDTFVNDVIFECVANGGAGGIKWFHNKQLIDMADLDSRFNFYESTSCLQIRSVRLADNGTYRCQLSDSVFHEADLIVQSEPQFIKRPTDQYVIGRNRTVLLECEASGVPKPKISWLFKGQPVTATNDGDGDGDSDDGDVEDDEDVSRDHSLRLNSVTASDSGFYQCIASNAVGNIQTAAYVSVKYGNVKSHSAHQRPSGRRRKPQSLPSSPQQPSLSRPHRPSHPPKPQSSSIDDYALHLFLNDPNKFRSHSILTSLKSDQSAPIAWKPAFHGDLKSIRENLTAFFNTTASQSSDFESASASLPLLAPSSTSFVSYVNEEEQQQKRKLSVWLSNFTHLDTTATEPVDSSSALVPELKPFNLTALDVSAQSITLAWSMPTPVDSAMNSSTIRFFSIYYQRSDSLRQQVLNTSKMTYQETIYDLHADKVYEFRVRAWISSAGADSTKISFVSDPIQVTTQKVADVPSAPLDVNGQVEGSTRIRLEWQPPRFTNNSINFYRIYYLDLQTMEQRSVDTQDTVHVLTALQPYNDYAVWLLAVNNNGPGAASNEILLRTLAAPPSGAPENITLEALSSSSVLLRWQPPARGRANGPLSHYKIRYRRQHFKQDDFSVIGDKQMLLVEDLQPDSVYQFRLSAVNSNGTGPQSDWYSIKTLTRDSDLDESDIPERPGPLKVRSFPESLLVSWTMPANQSTRLRKFQLGWGKGVPDTFMIDLDEQQRSHTIDNLDANSEYVISLRAVNNRGYSPQVYANVYTRDELSFFNENAAVLLSPPVGLRVQVLAATSVLVSWTDSKSKPAEHLGLGGGGSGGGGGGGGSKDTNNRYHADKKVYVVRYAPIGLNIHRYKYFNTSETSCVIDDLKPFTQYEFTVKTIKGRRESIWSMVATNTTWETVPGSGPRDLHAERVSIDGSGVTTTTTFSATSVRLVWEPPKLANGHITGYGICSMTDEQTDCRMQTVSVQSGSNAAAGAATGGRQEAIINDLQPDTMYYFKVQARTKKGPGPFTNEVSFRTISKDSETAATATTTTATTTNTMMIWSPFLFISDPFYANFVTNLLIILLVILLAIVLVACFVCCGCCRNRCTIFDRFTNRSKMKLTNCRNGHGTSVESDAYDGKSPELNNCRKSKLKHNLNPPPDLWIHHDQMELKNCDKNSEYGTITTTVSGGGGGGNGTLPRSTSSTLATGTATTPNIGAGDKRSYLPGFNFDDAPALLDTHQSYQPQQPQPHLNRSTNQYGRLNDHSVVMSSNRHLYTAGNSPIDSEEQSLLLATTTTTTATTSIKPAISASKKTAPFRSFSAIAQQQQQQQQHPPQFHVPKSIVGTQVTIRTQTSPYKKSAICSRYLTSSSLSSSLTSSLSTTTAGSSASSSSGILVATAASNRRHFINGSGSNALSGDELQRLRPSTSTEELNQEMANLEGLMKDLNAITASEFQC